MTLFGKILIGLILTLSLVFASLSAAVYSAQSDYVRQLEAVRGDLAAARTAAEDADKKLRDAETTFAAQLADVTEQRDTSRSEARDLTNRIGLLEEELASTRTLLGSQTALAEIAKTDADARRQEVLAGRERNALLADKYVAAEKQIAGLTDEVFGLTVATEQMAEKNNALLDEVGGLREQLRGQGIVPDPVGGADEPAPDVRGKVLAVRDGGSSGTLVAISLGSDDGLRKDDVLQVVRTGDGGKYVGKIQLRELAPDVAYGRLITRSKTATIQKGDDVQTRL